MKMMFGRGFPALEAGCSTPKISCAGENSAAFVAMAQEPMAIHAFFNLVSTLGPVRSQMGGLAGC